MNTFPDDLNKLLNLLLFKNEVATTTTKSQTRRTLFYYWYLSKILNFYFT